MMRSVDDDSERASVQEALALLKMKMGIVSWPTQPRVLDGGVGLIRRWHRGACSRTER